MVVSGLRLLSLAIAACLLLAVSASAEDLTAGELLKKGTDAYASGDFATSRDAFSQFIEDFGASGEATEAVGRVRPLLALSLVQLRQFGDAGTAIQEALADGGLDPAVAEELVFWKAVCEFDGKEYTQARVTLREFGETFPQSPKRVEALILLGTAFAVEGKHAEAAEYFAKVRGQLAGFERGRAAILELNSLLAAGQLDAARKLAVAEYRRMDDILQIVAFQTLMLNLGSQFLEAGRCTDAIACLQLVWPKERLLKHQEARLKTLQDQLVAAKQRKADAYRQFQLGQMIAKVRREVDHFKGIESFDAAVRMRLARAFQEMERYREAALVMEAMVGELPPDALVEQSSLNGIQCWMQVGDWPRAVVAASRFEERFPESRELPLALFMKGQAQQSDHEYAKSVETFDEVVRDHGDSPIAPRALFMAGFGELLQEDYAAALDRFEVLSAKYESDPMVETALYWKGMALSLAKEHAKSRDTMQAYLDRYGKNGRYVGAATFRRAYSAQAMKDYGTSIPELEAFLREYPGHALRSEALILLGDALATTGYLDEGITAYKRIPPDDTKFFEEGWFKVGKVLRLQEKNTELRAHMERFRTEHPKSPRIAEAVYWIGWTYMQDGEDEKARDTYWTTISELGDDPDARGVEDLFGGLRRLYKGDEGRTALEWRMSELQEKADVEGKETLATRVLWAQAKQLEKESPTRANVLFLAGAGRVDVQTASPVLLADFADALRSAGESDRAEAMYRDLLKWNPRALQKDRAFAGLGLLAMARGENDEALEYFDRFERETAGSPLFAEILLAKADLLLGKHRDSEAESVLNGLLESGDVGSRDKARALLALGDLEMAQRQPAKAIPYYQRVYVMYGRWPEYVARAYLRSGEAFEALDDREAAIGTYEEMLSNEALTGTREAEQARKRLEALKPDTEENAA